jgi:hypothetical protein
LNPLFEAASEMHQFFSKNRIPYAVIGGVALQRWGDQRFTKDVDITIAASLEKGVSGLVTLVIDRFPAHVSNPLEFARKTRMILVTASNGVDVDISLGLPGYEDEMFKRAIDYEIEAGKSIRLCSAEDLIIHKAVAGRPQDVSDIQGIVYRQGKKLDVTYIRNWINEFAVVLENPAVLERFESAWVNFQDGE